MFQKLGDALRRFMAGRYGTDKLNMAILAAALVGMLIGGLGARLLTPWLGICTYLS